MSERRKAGSVNRQTVRSWSRRADTILRRSENLLSDMLRELGTEHEFTDYADNVVHQAEDLAGLLANKFKALQERHAHD